MSPSSLLVSDFREHLQQAIAPAYDLEREITGGGMSRVFVATERALGRNVVVKVLPPELAAGVNKERFRREIQLAAQLQHPHIVPLLSAGERDELLWYTMPFIEGESLREALLRRGRFSMREVVRILHDVVDALAYAHSRGVIHRDIKPGNILTHGAHALVTDFGVAKALSVAMPHSGTTSVGIAIGTPAYMAPEQLAADPSADHRVDIYAVGLLAYELLTGEQPFTGPSPQATMAAQLTRMPTPLSECCPDVPAELSAVIMRCLAKSPEERPPSAAALLDELDRLTTPASGIAAPAAGGIAGWSPLHTPPTIGSTPPSGGAPARVPPPRRTLVLSALAVLAVAGGLVGLSMRGVQVGDRTPAPENIALATGAAAVDSVPGAAAAASAGASAAPAPLERPVERPAASALTRDDSLRIAEAVQRGLAQARRGESGAPASATPVNYDSLRRELTRQYSDPAMREVVRDAFVAAERAHVAEEMQRTRAALGALDSTMRVIVVPPPVPRMAAPPRMSAGASAGASGIAGVGMPAERRVAYLGFGDGTGRADFADEVRAIDAVTRQTIGGGFTLVDAALAQRLASLSGAAQRQLADSAGIGAIVAGVAIVRGGALVARATVLDVARGRTRTMSEEGDEEAPAAALGIVGDIVGALTDIKWERRTAGPAGTSGASVVAAPAPPPPAHAGHAAAPRVILYDLDGVHSASYASVARAITDSLRRVVRRSGIEVVDDAVTRSTPPSVSRRRAVGAQYGAGAIVAGSLGARSDTIIVALAVRDLHSGRSFGRIEGRAPAASPLDVVPVLASNLLIHLRQVAWARGVPATP